MTRSIFIVVAVLSLFVASPGPKAVGASTTDISKTLMSTENKWVAAIVKRDVATLNQIFADTYIDTNENGDRTNKQGVLALVKSADLKMKSITLSDMQVSVYGTAAVVTGRAVQIGAYQGVPLTRNVVFTDTFVLQSGIWRAVASQRAPAR